MSERSMPVDPHELPPDQASIVQDLQSLVPALWHYRLGPERLQRVRQMRDDLDALVDALIEEN